VYYIAIGKLCAKICKELSNGIVALKDISEIESKGLAQVLDIQKLENLFFFENRSLIAHYSGSVYLKFKTLIQLLTWSFSSIMEHFRMGALSEFEIDDLIHLVKALFCDTQLRVKNLKEIERGHP
jgi:centromere/kinetochore protein ZW10